MHDIDADVFQNDIGRCGMCFKMVSVLAIWIALAISGGQASASPEDGKSVSSTNVAYGIFGSREVRLELSSVGTKVARLFEKIDQEQTDYSICERAPGTCPEGVQSWRDAIKQIRPLDGLELLTAVNIMVNRLIKYEDDLTNHGRSDYWATPMESLAGLGDCEDFALLKYVTLRELGMADERMRIAIVIDMERNIAHAVLTVEMGHRTYVLDNTFSRPRLDSELGHYQPLYSLNATVQWLNVAARSGTSSRTHRPSMGVIQPAAPDGSELPVTDNDTEAER